LVEISNGSDRRCFIVTNFDYEKLLCTEDDFDRIKPHAFEIIALPAKSEPLRSAALRLAGISHNSGFGPRFSIPFG
jgi:hypothetical protein